MDEMPGMIRPDLQALPQVKDRMTFLYLEHCTLGRQDGAITVTENLSHIDESLCLSCGQCAVKCPRHAIVDLRGILTD